MPADENRAETGRLEPVRFSRAEKFNQGFRDAQAVFAEALGKLHEPGEAAKLADQSLAMAIDLSDQVAMFHGDLLLNRRRASNSLSKHIFGCRADSTVQNQKYKDTLADNFDYAVLPMSWKQLQPQEGAFQTEPVDEWVELLGRKRVPIIAGPLVDLSDGAVPDWMFIWEHDFETLREMAYEYVQKRCPSLSQGRVGLERGFRTAYEQCIHPQLRADHRAHAFARIAGEDNSAQCAARS